VSGLTQNDARLPKYCRHTILAMACAEHYRLQQEYEQALRKCAAHMHSSNDLLGEQALASRNVALNRLYLHDRWCLECKMLDYTPSATH
jgi:hypothetical protein